MFLEKLEEFNKKAASGVDIKKLESIVQLTDLYSHPSDDALSTLKELLHWSPGQYFQLKNGDYKLPLSKLY